MKASKALTVSVSVFSGQILWRFSLSKNISPPAPDLELILFPLWYWPIRNAHTKQQQDTVFETDFIDSQKSDPPFAPLLALSQMRFSQFLNIWNRDCKMEPHRLFFLRKKIIFALRSPSSIAKMTKNGPCSVQIQIQITSVSAHVIVWLHCRIAKST